MSPAHNRASDALIQASKARHSIRLSSCHLRHKAKTCPRRTADIGTAKKILIVDDEGAVAGDAIGLAWHGHGRWLTGQCIGPLPSSGQSARKNLSAVCAV
jgi:hypothetical protein